MINTQLAFITASALLHVGGHLDLDIMKEQSGVDDIMIERAEAYSNNVTVKSEISNSSSAIIKNIKYNGVNIRDLYASHEWSPLEVKDYNKDSYTTGTQTTSNGTLCHYNCHNQCHTNCHTNGNCDHSAHCSDQ
ncbi:hypothetical protein [Vibrio crassostreae]|uniref:hypothetical protein n=1 Tax=Vibrio crassostreae TaxID=246167 RepID=UPI001B315E90|nr:hypothetical protein [Vibrio crassostreae]